MIIYLMRSFLVLSFSCMVLLCSGQWSDSFEDGELLNNPEWFGDLNAFTVNQNQQLQLDAAVPETFQLFSQIAVPDSARWLGYALYDFAPSNNNNGAIFLGLDMPDITIANGYILRFGENGSEDAIRFMRLDQGTEVLLASGTLGAVASDPTEFQYRIVRTATGTWSAFFAYSSSPFALEFELQDNTYPNEDLLYFGVEAKVTSSNVDKVFFDDLIIEENLPDTTPPVLVDIRPIFPTVISLRFDEPMDADCIRNTENYTIEPGGIQPEFVVFGEDNPTFANLSFEPALDFSIEYTLTIEGVKDVSGNILEPVQFQFLLPESPTVGDIKISEIVFDPYQEMEDFVEIYNASQKVLSLEGVYIKNADKDEVDFIESDRLFLPGEYLAIMVDSFNMKQVYQYPDTANFIINPIPSFNNADGNFTVGFVDIQGVDTEFESFDYEEDFHFQLIDDTEGVSLERLSFSVDSDNTENWFSGVEATQFATPGYANGNQINFSAAEEDFVYLADKVFSPNSDGDGDQLELLFELEESGYLATVQIFDSRGYLIRDLVANRLVSQNDFILWDGYTDEGIKANLGIHIVLVKLFHTNGNIKSKKLVCVLADYLD